LVADCGADIETKLYGLCESCYVADNEYVVLFLFGVYFNVNYTCCVCWLCRAL